MNKKTYTSIFSATEIDRRLALVTNKIDWYSASSTVVDDEKMVVTSKAVYDELQKIDATVNTFSDDFRGCYTSQAHRDSVLTDDVLKTLDGTEIIYIHDDSGQYFQEWDKVNYKWINSELYADISALVSLTVGEHEIKISEDPFFSTLVISAAPVVENVVQVEKIDILGTITDDPISSRYDAYCTDFDNELFSNVGVRYDAPEKEWYLTLTVNRTGLTILVEKLVYHELASRV